MPTDLEHHQPEIEERLNGGAENDACGLEKVLAFECLDDEIGHLDEGRIENGNFVLESIWG